ncbi:hypothetical protein BBP40_003822 [Aspergillus hancockii]|nr:hypothetical protein BBP40_003822 [Aspergillus hancockii]
MNIIPEEIKLATKMLEKAVRAIEKLSPAFRVLVLPAGVKKCHRHLFYTHQHNLLKTLSKDTNWTYIDGRPDIIIGFVPNNSAHNLAQWLALYLSLYHKIHSEGAEVVFPGAKSWTI